MLFLVVTRLFAGMKNPVFHASELPVTLQGNRTGRGIRSSTIFFFGLTPPQDSDCQCSTSATSVVERCLLATSPVFFSSL